MKTSIRTKQRHFRNSYGGWTKLISGYDRFRRVTKYWYYRFTRMSESPERIARGLAIGIFSGFFPFFGAQMILAVLLAIPLRANKLAAALGTWISNPLTYLPLYLFNFHVGCLLLGVTTDFSSQGLSLTETLVALKEEFLSPLLVGCFVSGWVASLIGYGVAVVSIRSWRQHRKALRSRDRHTSKPPLPRATPVGRHR